MDYSIFIGVALGLFGLVAGSFAGATVWRLRARQLRLEVAAGEKVSVAEKKAVAKLPKKHSLTKDRSVCLHCGHTLQWYDLVPLVSWLSLGGKCRYCHKSIGTFEPLIEVGVAIFFVVSYMFWPTQLDTLPACLQFGIWLVAGVMFSILFAYDKKWFLLPDVVTFPLIGLGAANALLFIATSTSILPAVSSVAASCLILSGLYYVIYVASRHQWVGFGDVKLGLAMGLLLADWKLAILALFLANLIGTIIIVPMMLLGKIGRRAHIPFGPLLITGWAIAGVFGMHIFDWYLGLMLGV